MPRQGVGGNQVGLGPSAVYYYSLFSFSYKPYFFLPFPLPAKREWNEEGRGEGQGQGREEGRVKKEGKGREGTGK